MSYELCYVKNCKGLADHNLCENRNEIRNTKSLRNIPAPEEFHKIHVNSAFLVRADWEVEFQFQ